MVRCLRHQFVIDICLSVALFTDLVKFASRSVPWLMVALQSLKVISIFVYFLMLIFPSKASITELLFTFNCCYSVKKNRMDGIIRIAGFTFEPFVPLFMLLPFLFQRTIVGAVVSSTVFAFIVIADISFHILILYHCDDYIEEAAQGMGVYAKRKEKLKSVRVRK